MWIFKPKSGPILRESRFLHFFEAGWFTSIGWMIGYEIGTFACFIAIILGFGWEIANKFWIPGQHRFGDAWDWLFFVFGASLTSALVLLLRSILAGG